MFAQDKAAEFKRPPAPAASLGDVCIYFNGTL